MKSKDKKALADWDERVKQLKELTARNFSEDNKSKDERVAKARRDYKFFVETYLSALAPDPVPDFHVKTANRVRRNPEHFEWLQWGRGLAKSVVGGCNIPLWLWINGGIHFMIAICRNETLACELLDDIKLNFEGNELLRHDFGDQVSHGHWESGNFVTKNGVKFKGYGLYLPWRVPRTSCPMP